MKFFIQYEITGYGWAKATFEQGTTKVEMTASYLHDSLRELTEAALRLRKGHQNAVVVFMDEPGEHQIHINNEEGKLSIEIRWYTDWESWQIGPSDYKVVAEFTSSASRLRHQVLEVLNVLYVEMGSEAYHERWVEHEFPMSGYRELAAKKFDR